MIIIKAADKLTKFVCAQKEKGNKIGFVPTMGALHDGHLSLIKQSTSYANVTVSSIFVNPTQFNDPKDFEKYPVTIGNDIFLLEQAGCDVLFLPSVEEIYPDGLISTIHYKIGDLENVLEGKYRPGHFQGVCQVVRRLLSIVQPHTLFLGRKDYQQSLVIKRLILLIDSDVELITADTFREQSGLAMSSRNMRLSDVEKNKAAEIFEMLNYIQQHYKEFEVAHLEQYTTDHLLEHGFSKVDYVAIVNPETLQPITNASTKPKALALIAAYLGQVRLIDNIQVG